MDTLVAGRASAESAPSLGSTFGAAYIGACVMLAMFGVTTVQTWFYFASYPRDQVSFKALVALVFAMDTAHVGLVAHSLYYYLITNFGNGLALASGTWSLYASIGLNVGIALVSQVFFVGRIYQLSGPKTRWWLPPLCATTTLLHSGFGIATVAKWVGLVQFSRLHEIIADPVTPFAVMAVASDVAIAAALCGLLWNSYTDFRDTNNIISTLMLWAINRCLLTSVVAIVETIVFITMPNSFWFLGVDFVIGKLYANSLLATLNARRAIKGRDGRTTEGGSSDATDTSLRIATGISGDGAFVASQLGVRTGRSTTDGRMTPALSRAQRGAIDIELQDHHARATPSRDYLDAGEK